jgi:hypothetical protein
MEEKNFTKKLENMEKPGFKEVEPDKNLKLAIVGSKKSAAIGVWLLVVPCYFLFMVFVKYFFNINFRVIDIFEDFVASLDKSPVTKFITPLFFVGLPIAGIIINLLSIMFFEYDKDQKRINISIKLKPLNILLVVISGAVVSVFAIYLLTENIHHINN